MQQYIHGNINHEGYRYVSSEQDFFEDSQRRGVLQHLEYYDLYCSHGELGAHEHQCYWMVVSNLDISGAPDRLYLQVSGGDTHRTSFYTQGYLSDANDGYLYDSRLLRLLRTRFLTAEQVMTVGASGNLQRIDCDAMPIQEELHSASLDAELLRNILLALLQKKKVIIRLPATGKEAMQLSREYILAIYERLPYEQRAVNGFVTGISAAKLKDTVALPKTVRIMLMDADADFAGVKTNAYQTVFDLADPSAQIHPMLRENKEGKLLSYVPLIDFLAEQSPDVLDEFFTFCRSCMRENVNGNDLSISDYSMYLDFFDIGRGECSDNSIRNWAANVYSNSNSNSKWTPDIKKILYKRIVSSLTPERLNSYLLSCISSFEDLATLGVVDETERSQIRMKKGTEATIKDVNAALTLKMTELLMPYYEEGTKEMLLHSLEGRFVELGCLYYPFLKEEQPTLTTNQQLGQWALPAAAGQTTELVTTLRSRVHEVLSQFRDDVAHCYRTQYSSQCQTGLDRISHWLKDGIEALHVLYANLRECYLFEELIVPESDSGWNDAIGDRIADLCCQNIPRTLREYAWLRSFVQESNDYFVHNGGWLSESQQATVNNAINAWQYILDLHEEDGISAGKLEAFIADLEKVSFLQKTYPQEVWKELESIVASRLVAWAKKAYPCLTEKKPTAETVNLLMQIPCTSIEKSTDPIEVLRSRIYGKQNQFRDAVMIEYNNQCSSQLQSGMDWINQWCAVQYEGIDSLFAELQSLYLFDELMALRSEKSWNDAIGKRLVILCCEAKPVSLQDYRLLMAWVEHSRETLQFYGGRLSWEQSEAVENIKAIWIHILELSECKCNSLAELLDFFDDVSTTEMNGSLAFRIMESGMETLKQGTSRKDIFENLTKLLNAAERTGTKELLRQLVNNSSQLKKIPEAETAERLMAHLNHCKKLTSAGLMDGKIQILAWKVEDTAENLTKLLKQLVDYRKGDPDPQFINRHVRDWASENLYSNTDLMYRMAVRFPAYREKLIPVLARKHGAVTQEEFYKLYVNGCRKNLLCQGAGINTADSWHRHVESLFPEWNHLKPPTKMEMPAHTRRCFTAILIHTILMILAGLIPGVAMLLTGFITVWSCVIWLTVLAVILVVCETVSFTAKNRLQRKFARWLGLGVLPGIIVTIVCLII